MSVEIEDFLSGLGLSHHVEAFVANDVDMDLLQTLNDADLRELGVVKLGHRKRILAAAEALSRGERRTADTAARVQRRLLTLMFVDLVGSTTLSTRLGLESYRETIRHFQDIVTESVESFGGYVAKFMGDGVLVYFGYPQSHEDDAERAIRAGMTLVDRTRELAVPGIDNRLEVRVGIETGPVVVGEIVGQGAAQEHAALGSTPNLAARLQSAANPNTVFVGPASRRLSDGAADFESMGPYVFKGFEDPIPVWRVASLFESHERLERRSGELAPLIGRDYEIGALRTALSRTRLGAAATVHVVGEPGIGKSRLMREFVTRHGDAFTLLFGQCSPLGGSTAFHPFIDLLRRFRDTVEAQGRSLTDRLVEAGLHQERHVPYLRRLIEAAVTAPSVDPDLIGPRTREALSEMIIAHGRLTPTVLVVNDLHWIDERSSNVLEKLVRDPRRRGVLIVASFRPEFSAPWSDAPDVDELLLEPLSNEQAMQLFRDHVADEIVLADLAPYVERAGGNPLFLEEIARSLASSQPDDPAATGPGIPDTLAGLLMQRVDALPSDARRVLERASVAGRQFDIRLLGREADRHMADLVASGIVQELTGQPGRFQFHHALVQQIIYESLLTEDRRRLHGEVARRVEGVYAEQIIDVAEFLAQQFDAAGDAAATARYAFMAGNKALDLFALRDAQAWYQKCLDLTGPDGEVDDTLLLARAAVNQTQVLCWNGDFPSMIGLAQSHLAKVQTLGEIEEVSRLLAWIGEGYMHAGKFTQARSALDRAHAIGETLGDDNCIGYAIGLSLWLDSIVGDGEVFDELPARSEKVEALGESLSDRYLFTLSHYARWAHATQIGRIGAAVEQADRLQAMGRRDSYPPAECWGACLMALSQVAAGNRSEALAAAQQGLDAAASGFDRLMADLALGMTLVAADDPEQGVARLSTAPWRTERIGAFYFAYAGDTAYGRGLVRAGRVDEGITWLRDGVRWFEASGHRRAKCFAMLGMLEAAFEIGDAKEAQFWYERIVGEAASAGMDGTQAEAHAIAADLAERAGDLDAAIARNAAARAIAEPLGWLALEQQLNGQARRLEARRHA